MININTNSIDLILINNKENNNVNKELYRVLKPGGYLFGIDKPHKSHNSVCDIEDIGFEIKDSISYFFAENEEVKQDVICLAMKPLSEKTFAENVMRWGTGGLNIDGTRIKIRDDVNLDSLQKNFNSMGYDGSYTCIENINKYNSEGRYPANFIISEDIAPVLDKQSGYSKSIRLENGANRKSQTEVVISPCGWKESKRTKKTEGYNDEGGASRFFKNVDSYKELLKYIAIMGLPPKQGRVLFVGFNNAEEIIKEINNENGTSYEVVGGMN